MMGCCNHMMGCCDHMMGCYNHRWDGTIFTDCLRLSSRTAASGTPAQEREVQKLSEFGVQDPASMSGTFGCEGSSTRGKRSGNFFYSSLFVLH